MNNVDTDSSTEKISTDVFVSYCRGDRSEVLPIIQLLEQAGYNVWWDGLLEAGSVFLHTTEQALEEASAVLVVWTKDSVNSNWVRDEATSGRDSKRLVPITTDGSLPPLGFRQFQVIDFSKWRGQADVPEFQNVLNAIGSLTNKSPTPLDYAADRAKVGPFSRRSMLVLGGTTVVSLGGILAWREGFLGGTSGTADNSIAILPFANLSGDPSQSYFSDGLSEELRVTLSRSSGLQVAAETSSNSFKDGEQDAKSIAAELGVAYLLDGSVRRSGKIVRIVAQLIDGKTGFDSWSESFDRSLDDIFAVQSEIATTVASALAVQISSSGKLRPGATNSADAYDAYLRGRALYDLSSDEAGDRAALAQFEAAIDADENYAAAYAGKSRVLTFIANSYATGEQLRGLYDQAIAAARKATELAPDLAEAHSALGYVLFNGKLDIRGAYGPYRKSYDEGRGNADILQGYATYMARIGNFREAAAAINRAATLDPLNPYTFRTMALIQYASGQLKEATASVGKALSLDPDTGIASATLGDIAYVQGEYQQALDYYRKEPNALLRLKGLAIASARLDKRPAAQKAMKEMITEYGDNSLYQKAEILAQWGQTEEALDALEKAKLIGDAGLVLARNDPQLAPLHGEERFKALLLSLGFTLPQ